MGTTKLTRKEILSEDQVHGTIITLFDFVRKNKKILSILVVAAIVLALGIYGGLIFLDKKEIQAQEILGSGMEIYHAKVDPEATEDLSENSASPVFSSDILKYQAASRKFSTIVSDYGYLKSSVIAHYYLGLTQLKLGEDEEAVKNLDIAAKSSKRRTVGYLAKKVLARYHESVGNYEEAKKILEGMITDEQYDLPKEDLSMQLAGILIAEGHKEEAVKVLQEASSQGQEFGMLKQKLINKLENVKKTMQSEPES